MSAEMDEAQVDGEQVVLPVNMSTYAKLIKKLSIINCLSQYLGFANWIYMCNAALVPAPPKKTHLERT